MDSLRRSLLAAALISPAMGALARPRKKKVVRNDDAPDAILYGARDDVMRFAEELAAARGLDAAWLREQLAQARYQPQVAKLIMPPPAGTAKNWAAYRARFVEPRRLRAGIAFWAANEAWLTLANERYGVPPFVVVGIVGVETFYGQQMGRFRVMPTSLLGSYAGAMGMPQFMPSSHNKYAIDFDGDGHIDLHTSSADVIGSVAHYLAEFGWQRDRATHFEVAAPVEVADRAALLVPDILPSFTPAQFIEHGAKLEEAALGYDGLLALVELQNGEQAAPSYVAGTANFYAVTRYNWSAYYAMAVIDLGRAIERLT
jgi:membrane-bound lytic murein transglycosylase B